MNSINVKDIKIPSSDINKYFNKSKKTEENIVNNERKDDMICTYITRNKYSTKFSTLNDKKKIQVLDLGLNTLKLIDNKQLKWSEKEQDKKILSLNNEYNKEIENLKKELRKTKEVMLNQKKEINQQKNTYEEKIHNLTEKNYNDLAKKEEELKISHFHIYKNKLSDKDEKIQQINNKLKNKINKKNK